MKIPLIFDHFKCIEKISSGSYGIVYLAQDTESKDTEDLCAIKFLTKQCNCNIDQIINEVRIQSQIDHQNIVKIFDTRQIYFQQTTLYAIVMKYCKFNNLEHYLQTNSSILKNPNSPENTKILKRLFREILEAIDHIHTKGCIHSDIKPQNIMVDANGSAKISDFGFARPIAEKTLQKKGTLCFASPEMLTQGDYDGKKADIYAIGMTFYNAIYRKFPFDPNGTQPQVTERIVNRRWKLDPTDKFQRYIDHFIKYCPSERPDITKLIEMLDTIQ